MRSVCPVCNVPVTTSVDGNQVFHLTEDGRWIAREGHLEDRKSHVEPWQHDARLDPRNLVHTCSEFDPYCPLCRADQTFIDKLVEAHNAYVDAARRRWGDVVHMEKCSGQQVTIRKAVRTGE